MILNCKKMYTTSKVRQTKEGNLKKRNECTMENEYYLTLALIGLLMLISVTITFCGQSTFPSGKPPLEEPPKIYFKNENLIAEKDEIIEPPLLMVEPPLLVVEESIKKEPAYTEDDLFCLTAVIYSEAGADYCSDELRMAVGNVVLNRVQSDYYPGTIRKVIEQPKQYGKYSTTGIYIPKDAMEHAVKRAEDCARRLLEGERVLPENIIFQAEFKQGKGVYATIDGVYFCYLDEINQEQ